MGPMELPFKLQRIKRSFVEGVMRAKIGQNDRADEVFEELRKGEHEFTVEYVLYVVEIEWSVCIRDMNVRTDSSLKQHNVDGGFGAKNWTR